MGITITNIIRKEIIIKNMRFPSSVNLFLKVNFTIFSLWITAVSLPIIIQNVDVIFGQTIENNSSKCITFDNIQKVIKIHCKDPTTLTDIYNEIQDPDVLKKEDNYDTSDVDENDLKNNIWILDAGISIEKNSWLYINSTDTSWLKILSNDETESANGINVYGGLKIDSVKITSWDTEKNDYIQFEVLHKPREDNAKTDYDLTPRPYIRTEGDATGTTDITNSELAYLGYEEPDDNHGRSGLLYYGGNGSVIKGNEIHHLRFGFYSSGVSNITLEDNHVYNNYMYGFDPHTGTNNMIIRNNTVHDNGAMGIICSLNCYNILIEGNKVSNNFGSGIMLSRNMYDSIVRDNIVNNEKQCIFVSASHNNEIYDNKVKDCDNGIYLKSESSNNNVYNNEIQDTRNGILINSGSADNKISDNMIKNFDESIKRDSDEGDGNIITGNEIISE